MLDLTEKPAAAIVLDERWSADCAGATAQLALSPNGAYVALATVEGPISIIDVATGAVFARFAGHANGTTAIDWNVDGAHLASCGQDGTAIVWNIQDSTRVTTVEAGATWVERVAFAPDGQTFVTAAGKLLRLWSLDGTKRTEWPARSSTILDVKWRPADAGTPLFAAISYGAVGIYDPRETKKSQRELRWKGSSLVIAWSPNAKYLATGDQDSSVHFWIMRSGQDLQMSGYPRKVRELAWDRTSRYLATGGGAYPCVWDCSGKGPAGTDPIQLELHTDVVTAVRYAHGSGKLASASADGSVAIWFPPGGTAALAASGPGEGVSDIAWTIDDAALIVAREDGVVARYEPSL